MGGGELCAAALALEPRGEVLDAEEARREGEGEGGVALVVEDARGQEQQRRAQCSELGVGLGVGVGVGVGSGLGLGLGSGCEKYIEWVYRGVRPLEGERARQREVRERELGPRRLGGGHLRVPARLPRDLAPQVEVLEAQLVLERPVAPRLLDVALDLEQPRLGLG